MNPEECLQVRFPIGPFDTTLLRLAVSSCSFPQGGHCGLRRCHLVCLACQDGPCVPGMSATKVFRTRGGRRPLRFQWNQQPGILDRCLLAFPSSALILFSLLLTSCGPSPLAEPWVKPRLLSEATPTWRPPCLAGPVGDRNTWPTPSAPLPDALTLRHAIALALLHSPELAAFAWDVRAAEARAVHAGLSPNPRLGYSAANLDGPDGGDLFVHQTIRLSQVLELGGKRDKRLRLAQVDQRIAAWDYETKRLEVVTRVAQRHVAVIAVQQRLAAAERTLRLAEQVHAIVRQRVEAGVTAAAELDKATVRLSLERIGLSREREGLAAARQSLASTWGGRDVAFAEAVGNLDDSIPVPSPDHLFSLAQNHPRVARWVDEIEHRRRAVEMAKANGVPDITAGVALRHFPDADADDIAALVELSMPLAVIDRNQGRILEARYKLAKARAVKQSEDASLRADLAAAHARLASSVFAVRTLRDEALPSARSAFQAAKDAFENGKTDYLNVLDAERTLVDVERQLIDARASRQASAARLEGLLATPLEVIRK